MRIITKSAIDISESLASYILSSYIYQTKGVNVSLEKRLDYVNTGKFSRADIYYPENDMAIEVKSTAHGNDALKGVLQASMYKEQTDHGVFCMQKPRRSSLRDTLESMCRSYGVGLVYIDGIPSICSGSSIEKATGGCSKPFELWKGRTYKDTRLKIISNSRSNWASEFVATLDDIIVEYSDRIFDFKIKPKQSAEGLSDIHTERHHTPTVESFLD